MNHCRISFSNLVRQYWKKKLVAIATREHSSQKLLLAICINANLNLDFKRPNINTTRDSHTDICAGSLCHLSHVVFDLFLLMPYASNLTDYKQKCTYWMGTWVVNDNKALIECMYVTCYWRYMTFINVIWVRWLQQVKYIVHGDCNMRVQWLQFCFLLLSYYQWLWLANYPYFLP